MRAKKRNVEYNEIGRSVYVYVQTFQDQSNLRHFRDIYIDMNTFPFFCLGPSSPECHFVKLEFALDGNLFWQK